MVARLRRVFPLVGLAFVSAILASSCQKVPLLAPSGSTIAVIAGTNVLPLNGSTEIIAQVIEPSGTPPQSGTLVTFTTTVGSIQPSEASTDISGRARARFFAGTASGTATITAISGGVASGDKGSIKVAIGSAAVGGITLTASPVVLPSVGGSSTVTAKVLDTAGNVLPSVPVSFSSDAGSVSASVVSTDASGTASMTLVTNRTAKVTATAGIGTTSGTTTAAAPTATITVVVNSTGAIAAGTPSPAVPGVGTVVSVPITYTAVGTTGASPVTRLTVDWGDGQVQPFSGQPPVITHIYGRPGSFVIVITAFDAFGDTSTAAAAVTVASGEPSVGITANNDNPPVNTSVTFTVTASIPGAPTGAAIQNVNVDFGDGKTASLGASGGTVSHTYTSPGTYTAVATATTTNGQRGQGQTVITVKP